MRFFDAGLDIALRSDADLDNLAWFGAVGALVTASVRGRPDKADELLRAFDHLLEHDAERVRRSGLTPVPMLGVDAELRPRRSHPEVFARLDALAGAGAIGAVGPLDLDDAASLEIQLDIAARNGLAAVVSLPGLEGGTGIDAVAATAARVGQPLARVVFRGCDYTSIRPVLNVGGALIVDVSPGGAGVDGGDMLLRYGEPAMSRAMLASSGHAAFDVLAISKVAVRAAEGGVPRLAIDGLVVGNAARILGADLAV